MPTTTIQNIHLQFEITFNSQPLTFDCQIIDAELTLPGVEAGSSTEVACPGGIVLEPGATVKGQLTGNVFADPKDTGVTWALITLYQAGTEFPYVLTYWADQANTVAITFTGTAKVGSFRLPWTKPGNAKHPIDIALATAVPSRPTVAA